MSRAPTLLRRQAGMSLIEVMVALLIGLIGCVIVFQMFEMSEARKRTVSAGSDMDIAGRLGLMTLERDIQAGGYGFGWAASPTAITNAGVSAPVMGCNVSAYDSARPGGSQTFNFTLAPVLITDGAGGAPDTVTVIKGSSSLVSMSKTIDQSTATTKRIKADTGGRTGVQRGDLVVAISTVAGGGLSCALFEITGDGNADQLTFDHGVGVPYTTAAGASQTSRYNQGGGLGFALAPGEGRLLTLGPTPAITAWSVQNNRLVSMNNLRWTDGNGDGANDTTEAADLVINLQAQYGVDADGNGMIASTEWTTTAPADWTRLLAVRFALLTRSQEWDRNPVTTTVPLWSGGNFVMTNVDGTADTNPTGSVNNWRHYRYNVFETVVPIRNTIIGRQL
jgi:type IV pilus assembly protein PilW